MDQGTCEEIRKWKDIIAISSGMFHIAGLRADGTVTAAGRNDCNQCNVEHWKNIIAISSGENHTAGLRRDGTVAVTWDNAFGRQVESWRDIIAIASGRRHIVGLREDGSAVAAGDNKQGQCNVGYWRNLTAISCGKRHTAGLSSDGTVKTTAGDIGNWVPSVEEMELQKESEQMEKSGYTYARDDGADCLKNVSGRGKTKDWRDVDAIACGGYHTAGLRKDGTVVITGWSKGTQRIVEGWKDITSITCGAGYLTAGLRKDGTVAAAGYHDDKGDIEDWENIAAVYSGILTAGLKSDGTVVTTCSGRYDVMDWNDIIAVSCTGSLVAGLKKDGTVVTAQRKEHHCYKSEDGRKRNEGRR